MNIAIIGYGKMGREIERLAVERGHVISAKFSSTHSLEEHASDLTQCDVAIEFTRPEKALKHIHICLDQGIPVVVGTTGWLDQLEEVTKECQTKQGAILHASNFSVGVNLFFEINKKLAELMSANGSDYRVSMEEIHHTQKLDAPSGTALTLAEQILETDLAETTTCIESNEELTLPSTPSKDLIIQAKRLPDVPGTHTIKYQSKIDTIEITHQAHNREGFAIGSIVAAEWLHNKKGVFTMKDVLKF